MDDDMNTAGAIGLIFERIKEMNKLMDSHDTGADKDLLARLDNDRRQLFVAAGVLGLLEEKPEDFFKKLSGDYESVEVHEVEKLIQERTRARAEKDWARADAIRKSLLEMGVVLEDGPQGTTWRFDV